VSTQEVLVQVAREVQRRAYGKYRGIVVSNEDATKRGRVQLRVPSVLGAEVTGWAEPCLPFGGLAGHGWFAVPEPDAQVWVEFEEGDVSKPVWVGTFWQQTSDVPADAALQPPTTRLLQTPSGHQLRFDDKKGDEHFLLHHPAGAELDIDKDGNVTLTDAKGATVVLDATGGTLTVEDANGNKLTMTSAGITIEDANANKVEMASSGLTLSGQTVVVKGSQVMLAGQGGEPIIKGQSFLTLFATHVHPTAMGPSGPPVPQGEMSTLSTKVLTS
jgi:uncharacterized protein involved in type VI secretion and phage assembly